MTLPMRLSRHALSSIAILCPSSNITNKIRNPTRLLASPLSTTATQQNRKPPSRRTTDRSSRNAAVKNTARKRQDAPRHESLKSVMQRRRPSPSRPRFRRAALVTYTLPDVGLTCAQLSALAGSSQTAVLQCARELDADVLDADTVLPPAVIELVAEELSLHVAFQPQCVPLLPTDVPAADARDMQTRMPVVTVMGHVDHGKTSLLDALRKTDVAKHEHGGITQSVAAFRVPLSPTTAASAASASADKHPHATFIDTPGHAAFSTMRANGTVATDIVVLVVAADDGVMPQTIEAAKLARAAQVPVIIAVNKCDVDGANPDRVRVQILQQLQLNTEQLGGDVLCVDISAKTGENLSVLLDAIALQAELLELSTDARAPARAICLESRADRTRGNIATVVVRSGTLRKGDFITFQNAHALTGKLHGRVRTLLRNDGIEVTEAAPGVAVGIVGVRESIPPGCEVAAMPGEKVARTRSEEIVARNLSAAGTVGTANRMLAERAERARKEAEERGRLVGEEGEDVEGEQVEGEQDGEEMELPMQMERRFLHVVVKGGVKGSADAVAQCIQRISGARVGVRMVAVGVGDVTDVDVAKAGAALALKGSKDDSMIIAFDVKVKEGIRKAARKSNVQILEHSIIYRLEDEVKEVVEKIKMRDAVKEVVVGKAGVVRVFENGGIAGCTIQDGSVNVGDVGKVLRLPDEIVGAYVRKEVFRGDVATIKQFAESVKCVHKGSECGISLSGWSSFAAGDEIQFVSEETS